MLHLSDWLTTPETPFFSKITSTGDRELHDHSFFEIFYIIDGTIGHTLNNDAKTLEPGDILFLSPEDQHIFLRTEGNHCSHRDIIFRKSFFKMICDYIAPNFYKDYTEGLFEKKHHVSTDKILHFEKLLNQITTVTSIDANTAMILARLFAVELLGLLISIRTKEQIKSPKWFETILSRFNDFDYICEGLDAITKDIFYSHEHICRIFKQHIGMTMTDYLNKRRMEFGAELLLTTKDSILSISTQLGYSSISYFNKLFKLYYGCTPKEFKRKHLLKSQ